MNKPRHDEVAVCEATSVLRAAELLRGVAFALIASAIGCGAAPTVTPPPPEPPVEAPQTPEAPPETPSTATPPEAPPPASPVPKPS